MITKISILDVAGVLDPTLNTNILALQSLILIILTRSVNSKKMAVCYEMGLYWLQIALHLIKRLFKLIRDKFHPDLL